MPVCSLPRLLPLLLLPLVDAGATSTVRLSATQRARLRADHPSCAISARFVEARPERGKIAWVFDRLPSTSAGDCKGIEGRFQVWILEGSFSKLSHAPVYPMYIEEPGVGTELDLRLENRVVTELPARERYEGWFLASGDAPVKARAQ